MKMQKRITTAMIRKIPSCSHPNFDPLYFSRTLLFSLRPAGLFSDLIFDTVLKIYNHTIVLYKFVYAITIILRLFFALSQDKIITVIKCVIKSHFFILFGMDKRQKVSILLPLLHFL